MSVRVQGDRTKFFLATASDQRVQLVDGGPSADRQARVGAVGPSLDALDDPGGGQFAVSEFVAVVTRVSMSRIRKL
jgi:hypothetical protein